jgi:hypothetical protein
MEIGALAVFLVLAVVPPRGAALPPLFRIGEPDGLSEGFGLADEGYGAFAGRFPGAWLAVAAGLAGEPAPQKAEAKDAKAPSPAQIPADKGELALTLAAAKEAPPGARQNILVSGTLSTGKETAEGCCCETIRQAEGPTRWSS